ncbi:hypothetical protein, partial [Magnetospirillum sp. LM-5]|uniref:hypothetical protein n=1 Tax=Magnetospirillum sp. LM-5 TaxID=2681466 RepID=UPI001C2D4F07
MAGYLDGYLDASLTAHDDKRRAAEAARQEAEASAGAQKAEIIALLIAKHNREISRLDQEWRDHCTKLEHQIEELKHQLEESHQAARQAKAERAGWWVAAKAAKEEMIACPEEHELVKPSGYKLPRSGEELDNLNKISFQGTSKNPALRR